MIILLLLLLKAGTRATKYRALGSLVHGGLVTTSTGSCSQSTGLCKKLVTGCEKSSARLQPAQAGHARLVLNKTVTLLRTTLYTTEWQLLFSAPAQPENQYLLSLEPTEQVIIKPCTV